MNLNELKNYCICHGDDQEAWNRLFSGLYSLLKELADSKAYEVSSADMDDLIQDLLISISGKLHQIKDIRGYCKAALHYCVVSQLEKSKRQQKVASIVTDELQLDDEFSQRARALQPQFTSHLKHVIRTLPHPYDKILMERCFEQASYRDISQQHNIKINQVGITLKRSYAQLRKVLKTTYSTLYQILTDELF